MTIQQIQYAMTIAETGSINSAAKELCSGIICEELNGDLYRAVPLKTEESMTVGYIHKRQVRLSAIAEKYIQELKEGVGTASPWQPGGR